MRRIFGNLLPRSLLGNGYKRLFTHHSPQAVEQFRAFGVRKFDHILAPVENPFKQVGFKLQAGYNLFFDTVFGNQIDPIDTATFLADPVHAAGRGWNPRRCPQRESAHEQSAF